MGVSHSKVNNEPKLQIIDFGSIMPLGLYNKSDEYDLNLVKDLILSKKLSPFYKGLSSPLELATNNDSSMKNDEKIEKQGDTTTTICMNKDRKKKRLITKKKNKHQNQQKEAQDDYTLYLYNNEKKLHHILYSNSVECPICFLYYPANINFARCCDQPICTECFVQIKKGPGVHTTSSDSASSGCSNIVCPYCMTEDFGIIYQSPSLLNEMNEKNYQVVSTTSGLSENQNSKRKSIESSHPDVVLIDHVRSQQKDHKIRKSSSSSSRSISRRASTAFWFQTRPSNATSSLESYLATIRLDDMSMEDIMVIQSIQQSLIDNEQQQQHVY